MGELILNSVLMLGLTEINEVKDENEKVIKATASFRFQDWKLLTIQKEHPTLVQDFSVDIDLITRCATKCTIQFGEKRMGHLYKTYPTITFDLDIRDCDVTTETLKEQPCAIEALQLLYWC